MYDTLTTPRTPHRAEASQAVIEALEEIRRDFDEIVASLARLSRVASPGLIGELEAEARGVVSAYNIMARRTGFVPLLVDPTCPF